ncbi:DNA replication protein DnaC [Paracoccus aminovorans]|nr:IS21 family transposase [Paracoccus aminovorans]
MRAAYDELMALAVRRQHEPRQIVGDLLAAEINEKKARSVKYQITTAKLPHAREIEEFTFDDTPINETLVRDLASGEFLSQQRNVVLVGGTGTGKTHISVAIARAVIRNGARGRFFNVVDLVNRLEAEGRAGRAGRLAEHLMRLDFVILDELGYLPFAQSGGQLLFHLVSKLYEQTSRHRHHQPRIRRVADRLRRREDDHRAARPSHSPLRHRRNRQRQLAHQNTSLTALQNAGPRRLRQLESYAATGLLTTSPEGSLLDADKGALFNAD